MDSFIWTRERALYLDLYFSFLQTHNFPVLSDPRLHKLELESLSFSLWWLQCFYHCAAFLNTLQKVLLHSVQTICMKFAPLGLWSFLWGLAEPLDLLGVPLELYWLQACMLWVVCAPPCFLSRLQWLSVKWTSPLQAFFRIQELINTIFLFASAPFALILLGPCHQLWC